MSNRLTVKAHLQHVLIIVEDLIIQPKSAKLKIKLLDFKQEIVLTIEKIEASKKEVLGKKTINRITELLRILFRLIMEHHLSK
jgi:hypothetical protein